jgi:hypothetical protein
MSVKFVIFKLRPEGFFAWIEAVEDTLAAEKRLKILSAEKIWRLPSLEFFSP